MWVSVLVAPFIYFKIFSLSLFVFWMSASLATLGYPITWTSSSFWEAHFGRSSLGNMWILSIIMCFHISLVRFPPLPTRQPRCFERRNRLEHMAPSSLSLSLVLPPVFPCNRRISSSVGETPSLATTCHYFASETHYKDKTSIRIFHRLYVYPLINRK